MRAASWALIAEKLWPRLWLPLAIAGVFVLLSVFEVWQLLPPRTHFGLLCAFAAVFVASFLPLALLRRPSRESSLARLEQASALAHRPLTAFNDTLLQENPSPETVALWEAHRARAAQALSELKAGMPHPRIDKYDPFALRAALVLMLCGRRQLGMERSWQPPQGSVHRAREVRQARDFASMPGSRRRPIPGKSRLCLPRLLRARIRWPVPQGSVLTVKINGPDAAGYRVELEGGQKRDILEPGQSSATYAEYIQKIEQSATLSIRRSFGADRTWTLTAVPKERLPRFPSPALSRFRREACFFSNTRLRTITGYRAPRHESTNHSAARRGGRRRAGSASNRQAAGLPALAARPPVKSAEGKTYRDLTAHPWAGLPVVITLIAKDKAGHEGMSAARGMILPERKFTKPLAKAIAGQRRSLVEAPSDAPRIASNLNALSLSAADEGIPSEVYLNLRSAYWRLGRRLTAEDVESVADQLWDAALIEDGNLSSAERELRAAQERLKDALESGASQEDLQKLMAELRQALNRYLQALMQQKQGKSGQAAQSPDAKTVSPQDLQQLLNKIENLAKAGSPRRPRKC